jgi:hypothetical protein
MLSGMASAGAPGKHERSLRWRQEKWCREHGGTTDAVLPDQTRSDCVTDTHAIAFQFARDWSKALGLALYYSLQSGKKAGVVLIIEDEKQDLRYWLRLNTTILHFKLPVETWETWD